MKIMVRGTKIDHFGLSVELAFKILSGETVKACGNYAVE